MKIAATITILLLLSVQSWSQKLVENKTDEFTKHVVKRTSWETLMEKAGMVMYLRISKIDSTEYLDVKSMLGPNRVVSIGLGETLMLKLSNDSIVKLKTLTAEVACIGCGAKGLLGSRAYGVQVAYVLDAGTHDLLKKYSIERVRQYTTDGYFEKDVPDKKSSTLQDCLVLVE